MRQMALGIDTGYRLRVTAQYGICMESRTASVTKF